MAQRAVYVLNGPDLNLPGVREPAISGRDTLANFGAACRAEAEAAALGLVFGQTSAEHVVVEWRHEARVGAAGIVINPAAFSYAAYAVLDALKMCACPIIEADISNTHRRKATRRASSMITAVVTGIASRLGTNGYALAVRHVAHLHSTRS